MSRKTRTECKLSESVKTDFDASILNRTKLLLHPHPHIQNLVSVRHYPTGAFLHTFGLKYDALTDLETQDALLNIIGLDYFMSSACQLCSKTELQLTCSIHIHAHGEHDNRSHSAGGGLFCHAVKKAFKHAGFTVLSNFRNMNKYPFISGKIQRELGHISNSFADF